MKVTKTGLGNSDYIDFEDGEYNIIYIGSSSWGSGVATLMYSPDGILPNAPFTYSNFSGVSVSSNTVVELKSYDGKVCLNVTTDPNLTVVLNIAGKRNPYN